MLMHQFEVKLVTNACVLWSLLIGPCKKARLLRSESVMRRGDSAVWPDEASLLAAASIGLATFLNPVLVQRDMVVQNQCNPRLLCWLHSDGWHVIVKNKS